MLNPSLRKYSSLAAIFSNFVLFEMKNDILKYLGLTFALSVLLTEFLLLLLYLLEQSRFKDLWVPLPTYFLAILVLNIILAVTSLPALFLTNKTVYMNVSKRILAYFLFPLLALLALIIFTNGIWIDYTILILSGISYLVFYSWFYRKLTRAYN